MKKVLFIVEGEKDEEKLLKSLFNSFSVNEQYELIPIKHNISMIFDKIKDLSEGSNTEHVDFIQVFKSILISEKREQECLLLDAKIPYRYLFFDLDAQHNSFNFKNVKDMLDYFNDETEEGKLLINYPQFEAFRDYQEPIPDPAFMDKMFSFTSGYTYKQTVHKRGTNKNYSKYSKNDYGAIITQNMCKLNYIIDGRYERPSFLRFLEEIELHLLADREESLFVSKKELWVLCSLVFVVPLFFGKEVERFLC